MEIPGYTLLRELGRGGMATVYLARQDRLGRQVALKVMQPPPGVDADFSARFIKEGRIIARLQHPRIVTIYDLDSIGELHYFSMEFLPNGTLADLIQTGLSETRTLEILRCLAEALGVAHDNGVIHRDIKPQNILLRADGSPVLTDFGIARAPSTGGEATALTTFGMVIGSPRYMSPEQSMSRPIDARADLYSLGCVFYEMLTQEQPYQAEDVISLAMQHCSAPLPELPQRWHAYQGLLERLLAKEPEQRFGSTQALIRALDQLQQGRLPEVGNAEDDAATLVATVATQVLAVDQAPTQVQEHPTPPAQPPTPRRGVIFGSILLLLLGLGAGVFLWLTPPMVDQDSAHQAQAEAEAEAKRQLHQSLIQATDLIADGQLHNSLALIEQGLLASPEHPKWLELRTTVRKQLRRAAQQQRLQAIANCVALETTADTKLHLSALDAAADCLLGFVDDSRPNTDLEPPVAQLIDKIAAWAEHSPPQAQLEDALRVLARLAQIRPTDTRLAPLRRRLATAAGLRPDMQSITGGCFRMGSPEQVSPREADETPQQVCVQDFALATSETRYDDFARFVAATDYRTDAELAAGGAAGCWSFDQEAEDSPWDYHAWATWRQPNKYQPSLDQHPVTCISARDARAYLRWLSDLTGEPYRLPSEAEWEYAARAGTDTPVFWGQLNTPAACEHANVADLGHDWSGGFDCDDGHEWMASVKHFAANPWGLHDMLGNAAEWTCSEYRDHYDARETQCAAPESPEPLVLRGGAWNSGLINLRAAYRNRDYPLSRYSFVGFRIARDGSSENAHDSPANLSVNTRE